MLLPLYKQEMTTHLIQEYPGEMYNLQMKGTPFHSESWIKYYKQGRWVVKAKALEKITIKRPVIMGLKLLLLYLVLVLAQTQSWKGQNWLWNSVHSKAQIITEALPNLPPDILAQNTAQF